MYLCLCMGITESDVREAGRRGCVTPRQLKARFGLTDENCCGRCAKHIREFVELAVSQAPAHCQPPA
jgi:bacterioferritin-associated ferredoxin